MSEMKQARSPQLGVVFQLTEVDPQEPGGRAWEIHDVERNRGFKLSLGREKLKGLGKEAGAKALNDTALEAAILVALERALQSPPEKVSGGMYDLELTAGDFEPVSAR